MSGVALALLVTAGGAVTAFDEAAWRAALEKDRAEFREFLAKAPNSYFAAVQRTDFGDKPALTVGRDAKADVHLDDASVQPMHLRVTVQGDEFRVEGLDGATFRTKDGEQRDAVVKPSEVQVGRFTLRLSHQRFPAIIVFDPERLKTPSDVHPQWWPPAPAWRVLATLVPAAKPEETVILSTRGLQRRALKVGRFEFEVHGRKYALEADRLLEPGVGESDVSVFFRDATTGKESYPVGRYIDPEKQADGRWLLDFNAAYNPSCAYSPHYNCPIPPRANVLPIAVEAGEKTPQGH